MDRLGRYALLLALALAVWGLLAAVVGLRRQRPLAVESARTTAFALLAVVVAANGAMLAALLSDDFTLRYVAQNSSRATPTFFKVLALWSADDGSLLLWNLVLAGYLAAVAFRFRRYRPEALPGALAVMYAVAVFYLLVVSGPSEPFATLAAPPDGRGPTPLLQNHPLMAVHPPFLYLGFVGLTVPFAFAIAGLVSDGLSDRWVALTRRWTLAVWCFLTVGLLLGALWSYSVLGWGGYWAWDPVENAALLPWLVTTALLHSVMLQERRGMLAVWNLSLAVGAFALATFGTFLTRGNVLLSVHTFATSAVGPMYLGFLVLVLAGGFGLIATRAWRLRAPGRIDAVLSREASFVGNNLLLLTLTFVVLLGTVFPLAVEATSGRQVTVGGPYFRRTTVPLMLLLLFLAGVGPLLPWRSGSAGRLTRRLRLPLGASAALMLALAVARAPQPRRGGRLRPGHLRRGRQPRRDRRGPARRRPDRQPPPAGGGTRGAAARPAPLWRPAGPRRPGAGGARHHRLLDPGPPDRPDAVPRRHRHLRRLHPPLRGHADAAPAAADRAGHRRRRGQRRPRPGPHDPLAEPLPVRLRADRHPLDPHQPAPRPLRVGGRRRTGGGAGHLPVLPQPGRDLAVGRRRRDGARRSAGGLADPSASDGAAASRPVGPTPRARRGGSRMTGGARTEAAPASAAAGQGRPRRALLLAAVVAAVALAAWLLSAGLQRDPTAIRSPLLGRPAPDFALRTLEGDRTVRLGELRGQVVVVNFWASWCAECRVEHPALSAAWNRFRDAGVVLVGVDFQDDHPSALAYLAGTGTGWPVVADPGSRTALAYGVYGIPETFVIGPDGRVTAKHVGPVTYDQLVREITRVLPGGSGRQPGAPAVGSR